MKIQPITNRNKNNDYEKIDELDKRYDKTIYQENLNLETKQSPPGWHGLNK